MVIRSGGDQDGEMESSQSESQTAKKMVMLNRGNRKKTSPKPENVADRKTLNKENLNKENRNKENRNKVNRNKENRNKENRGVQKASRRVIRTASGLESQAANRKVDDREKKLTKSRTTRSQADPRKNRVSIEMDKRMANAVKAGKVARKVDSRGVI